MRIKLEVLYLQHFIPNSKICSLQCIAPEECSKKGSFYWLSYYTHPLKVAKNYEDLRQFEMLEMKYATQMRIFSCMAYLLSGARLQIATIDLVSLLL